MNPLRWVKVESEEQLLGLMVGLVQDRIFHGRLEQLADSDPVLWELK